MDRHRSSALARWWGRSLACLLAIAALAVTLAACGKTSSNSSPTSPAATTTATTSAAATTTAAASTGTSGCGTAPSLPFHDPSGVISSLGSTYETAYSGNPDPIYASAYANFKPKKSSGFTIGMAFSQAVNSFQADTIPLLQKDLAAIKGVSHVTLLSAPITGLTTQIQQVNQLIQQHVDVIVAEPLVPQPFIPLAAKAEKAGIPFISVINGMPTPDALSIGPNATADGANIAAGVAKLINGTGTVLGVHGIPSTGVDHAEFTGYSASFAKCPGVKFDTSLVGQFVVPVAKQQVLTYLSNHPQPVAGAVQPAGMTSGIIQAFDQVGRPQPAHGIGEPVAGELAYWNEHMSTFKAVAAVIGPQDVARAVSFAVAQLLTAHGPKVSEIVQPSVLVTSANLSQFLVPGAGTSSQATVEGPPNSWMTDSFMAPLFNK